MLVCAKGVGVQEKEQNHGNETVAVETNFFKLSPPLQFCFNCPFLPHAVWQRKISGPESPKTLSPLYYITCQGHGCEVSGILHMDDLAYFICVNVSLNLAPLFPLLFFTLDVTNW